MVAVSNKKRRAVATAMLALDDYWAETFADLGLEDLNYSDLFFRMWLHAETPLTKTGLYEFMPGVSRRTAVKYVQGLIDLGLLIEESTPGDRRVKYVSLSAELCARLERYLDFGYGKLQKL